MRFRRRVSTLPRTGSICRSGRRRRSCETRRIDAVATRAPTGTSSHDRAGPTHASRGSARSRQAARHRPSTSSPVRSLAECTATSMRPSHNACSSSLAKMPRPPISANVRRASRSPWVESGTIATVVTEPRSATAAICACAIASRDARVPDAERGQLARSQRRADRRATRLRGLLARGDAVGYADSAVGRAGHGEDRVLGQSALDDGEPFEAAQHVLRHAARPAVDTCEERFGAGASVAAISWRAEATSSSIGVGGDVAAPEPPHVDAHERVPRRALVPATCSTSTCTRGHRSPRCGGRHSHSRREGARATADGYASVTTRSTRTGSGRGLLRADGSSDATSAPVT